MSPKYNSQLKIILESLINANNDYDILAFARKSHSKLGPPCTEEQVQQLEREYDIQLPPSYCQFLMLHNGWWNFSGEAHILSTTDRNLQGIIDRIEDFNNWKKEDGNTKAEDRFVIVCGEGSTYIVYLDLRTRREDGEMDVVEFGYLEGEMDRYSDFISYLEEQLAVLNRMIARERGELPPLGTVT